MADAALAPAPLVPSQPVARPRREGTSAWPLIDRVGYWACWATGALLALVTAWILVLMLVKGISYFDLKLLVTSPAPSVAQASSGGFLDPIVGTLLVTGLGTLIAGPLGVALAVWLVEYGRPRWLARVFDSAIEVIAGVPSVVLAIFGLLIFAKPWLAFLSQRAANGSVYGRSFFATGIVMSALALPLVVGSTREALTQLPRRLREASFALGKTKATTIRHVLLPSIRPGIATGVVLGMGRIIGDTAIIRILLGVSLTTQGVGGTPLIGTLRGTGSTLTSYVYENSPAGEGSAPQKAYFAAFVLLVIVLGLNAVVTWITTRGENIEGRGRSPRRPAWTLLRFGRGRS
jgi:phosphate transport system permease protein